MGLSEKFASVRQQEQESKKHMEEWTRRIVKITLF